MTREKLITMTEKTKSWVKENIMGLILAGMFTAFWVSYEADRQEAKQFRIDESKFIEKLNGRQQIISQCVYYDPDTRPELREIIYEWIKLETRGQ